MKQTVWHFLRTKCLGSSRKRFFHTESLPLKICVLPDISSISFVNSFVPESWKLSGAADRTGPNFTAPDGHPANTLGGDNPWIRKEMAIEVTTPEQVHEGILELKKAGVDFLKFTYQGGDYWYFDKRIPIAKIKKELMEQIIREGKENGLKTTAHVFYKEDVRQLLKAGIYGIEHGVLDRDSGTG